MSQTLAPGAVAPASARPAWMIGGGIAALALTVGAAFALSGGASKAPPAAPVADSLASGETLLDGKAAAPAKTAEAATLPTAAKPVAITRKEPRSGSAAQPVAKATPAAPGAVAQAPLCADCGTVESVREVVKKGEGSGVGAVAGGVLGGVLGHQIGSGRGNTAATVVGAGAGAYAGHQVEKSRNATTTYQVIVKTEDGKSRTFNFPKETSYRVGDKIKIVDGKLTRP